MRSHRKDGHAREGHAEEAAVEACVLRGRARELERGANELRGGVAGEPMGAPARARRALTLRVAKVPPTTRKSTQVMAWMGMTRETR